MGRPKNVIPTVRIAAYISEKNFAMLGLLTRDPEGKPLNGEISRVVDAALSEYFTKMSTPCIQPKSNPA